MSNKSFLEQVSFLKEGNGMFPLYQLVYKRLATLSRLTKEHTLDAKINTVTGALEYCGWINSLSRYSRGDSRQNTYMFIKETFDYAADMLMFLRLRKDSALEVSLVDMIRNAVHGIDTLKATYKSDAKFCEDLNMEQQRGTNMIHDVKRVEASKKK